MTTGAPFRAALVQLCVGRDIAANVEAAAALIREAAGEGAQYVQTPENTNVIELERARLLDMLGPPEDETTLETFRALARTLSIWLHLGSIVVRLDERTTANRAVVIAPDGSVAATYDKIHMFDVDLAGGESYRESKAYRPGSEAVSVDLPWARLGLSICYDLRFPALYRSLAQAGAEILAVPSAFTRQTGAAHWSVLQRARAIENGCYVLSAAQGGRHESGRETWGHTIAVAPWGEVLGERDDTPGLLLVDVDPAAVAEARRRIPSLTHDRPFTVDAPTTPRNETLRRAS